MGSFGDRLKDAFGGIRNIEIAKKMGVSESAVSNYLNGRVPDLEKLLKIRDLTNCNLHWLLTGDGPMILGRQEFDLEYVIDNHDDWTQIIDKWYEFEGQENPMPDALGASFMGGWQSFSRQEKIDAIKDFKAFLDRIKDKD